jgi:hypothetical protein
LWVFHDPNYKPGGNLTIPGATTQEPAPNVFFAAAADTLNWWLPEANDQSKQ